MKVGILTFHNAHNYGAVLQAFALKKYLVTLGVDAQIIDYRCEVNERSDLNRFFRRRNLAALFVDFIFKFKRFKNKNTKFSLFINNELSPQNQVRKPIDFESLNYDAFIIGSDQVWNTNITKGFDPIFWGKIKQNKPFRLISYAASAGNTKYNSIEQDEIIEYLKGFDAIGIRELDTVNEFSNFSGLDIKHVFDPTFLIEEEEYLDITSPPLIDDRYVLVYQVVDSAYSEVFAKQIANQIGARVVFLRSSIKSKIVKNNSYDDLGPKEYLSLIKNASCVITTSFHGTAFSLIFRKSFYLMNINSHNLRPLSLLKSLGLEERVVIGNERVSFKEIDYNSVNNKINEWRDKSRMFLNENVF